MSSEEYTEIEYENLMILYREKVESDIKERKNKRINEYKL